MSDSTRSGVRPLVVRGARTHNLRGIDLELPHEALVVVTGPSGSGKSSLAFATIHAESVRRYLSASRSADVDSIALASMPDVDSVEGLSATLGLSQRGVVRSPRTTVATLAGVSAPLRRVFGRFGRPSCPVCGGETVMHDVSRVVDALSELPEGLRVTLLAEVARGDVGDGRATLDALARAGFVRARIDGSLVDIAGAPVLAPRRAHVVEAVIDRLALRSSESQRLREAVELAYRTGQDEAIVLFEGGEERRFSRAPRCVDCGSRAEPVPHDAFLADPAGFACVACAGRGYDAPIEKAPKRRSRVAAAVDDDEQPAGAYPPCTTCDGLGLVRAALDVRVGGLRYREIMLAPVAELTGFVHDLRARGAADRAFAPALDSLANVGAFLVDVGLGHLSLARRAPTLSTGELARVRLAGLLANELTGLVYVLDEPTAGLHPIERPAIVRAMQRLVARGNSVLCVEHDPGVIAAADHVVELGVGAGPEGGRLLASCPPGALPESSLTRALLRGELRIEARKRRRVERQLTLYGVTRGPLLELDLAIPRGALTFVTGESGSGKTTLLELLADAHRGVLSGERIPWVRSCEGFDGIARSVRLDDVALVAGPRALVATRLGLYGALREVFASLPEARMRGYDAARFALHAPGGRCEACAGTGRAQLEPGMQLVDAPCDRCEGRRFDEGTLAIRYRGLSLADVLEGTVIEGIARFEALPAIHEPLSHARRLGLGYLTLGRTLRGLSGGELERLRLAAELAGKKPARTLYLLDEPSRGLHAVDVARLVGALDELVEAGATVVVADHSLAAIAAADHVVDLGVEPGSRRTILVDAGSPAEVASRARGPTGHCLAGRATAHPEHRERC